MKKQFLASVLAASLIFGLAACTPSQVPVKTDNETLISLSDSGVSVDGQSISSDETAAVYAGAEIIYYKDGTDASYGEGKENEKHSTEEAVAHTVVTITQPGTYRLTGTLSAGQIAVDLGKDAVENPEAVVTLILDNANVTCTVAPALIFYNVYECGTVDTENASPNVDTSAAGANVIIAAGSENNFTGSHVARIYKEGTTKKLHKYDGAFYSKRSMNISGDNGDDSGVLNIIADNEGMNSELHLTINGGTINISAQDDGINTNEDYVSVTTVNGGTLTVNAGLGAEGDGIDSNGYLTINGGTVWAMSNERTPDGGIDADSAITINGGMLYAFGTRNDASDNTSAQPYMELAFASTLPAGTHVKVADANGTELWSAVTRKAFQSITLSVPELTLNTVYNVYVDDVLQCYSGNSFGMGFHGGMGGNFGGQMPEFDPNQMPGNMELPEGFIPGQMPGGFESSQRPNMSFPGGEGRPNGTQMPEGFDPSQFGNMNPGQMPGNMDLPDDFDFNSMPGGDFSFPGMGSGQGDGSGSTEFILTETTKSFSGVCDSDVSGKTRVSFTVEGSERSGRGTILPAITAISASVDIAPDQVQITVTDSPSEDYSESCTWADGLDAINALLPEDPGSYLLTIAVVSGNETYTGATQLSFLVPERAD